MDSNHAVRPDSHTYKSVYYGKVIYTHFLCRAAARRESNDKQQLKILQEELSKNVVKLNASTGANKTLEAQLAHYKEQLKKIENTQVGIRLLAVV